MPNKFQEVYVVIVIGIILALLLIGFIVLILFLYQRRQHRQEKELTLLKDQFDKELLQSQLEIKENTFKTIAQELHDNIGQMLSVVKFSLAGIRLAQEDPNFETIQESKQMLNKAIFDLSDLTKSMHTDRITQIGLVEAIKFEMAAPISLALFTMLFNPTPATRDSLSCFSLTLKPRPLSFTTKLNFPASEQMIATFTWEALECLIVLFMISWNMRNRKISFCGSK